MGVNTRKAPPKRAGSDDRSLGDIFLADAKKKAYQQATNEAWREAAQLSARHRSIKEFIDRAHDPSATEDERREAALEAVELLRGYPFGARGRFTAKDAQQVNDMVTQALDPATTPPQARTCAMKAVKRLRARGVF